MQRAAAADNEKLWDEYTRTREPRVKDEIVKRFLPLVRYVASRMSGKIQGGLDFDDILSFGVLGLLDAVDRFEPERGFCFQTFAVTRIRGAILTNFAASIGYPGAGGRNFKSSRGLSRISRKRTETLTTNP